MRVGWSPSVGGPPPLALKREKILALNSKKGCENNGENFLLSPAASNLRRAWDILAQKLLEEVPSRLDQNEKILKRRGKRPINSIEEDED